MFDLRWTELSLGISFIFNILFFLFILLFYGKYAVRPQWKKEKMDSWLMFFSVVLIIFTTPFNSDDWFNYQELVWTFNYQYGTEDIESIYAFIIKIVNRNYFLFRVIVWGSAFIITCLSFKRFQINVNVAIFFLISVFLIKFNYARATLAMSCYFLGLSFLFIPINNHRYYSLLLALVFLYFSYCCHSSMLPVLLLTLVTFLPIEKPLFLIGIAAALPSIVNYLLENGLFLVNLDNDYIIHKLSIYESQDTTGEQSSIWGVFRLVLVYGSFFVPIIIDTFLVIKNRLLLDLSILKLYKIMLAILFFASSFLFLGLNTYVFSYRYLFMTFIPITILSVYLYSKGYMSKNVYIFILLFGLIMHADHYLYGLYQCL